MELGDDCGANSEECFLQQSASSRHSLSLTFLLAIRFVMIYGFYAFRLRNLIKAFRQVCQRYVSPTFSMSRELYPLPLSFDNCLI